MSATFTASVAAFGSAPSVLVTLVASLIFLIVRAWRAVTGLILSRRVSLLLDAAIVVFLALFLVLVLVRFKTLA